jgi:glycosyltransferase 2 family protein
VRWWFRLLQLVLLALVVWGIYRLLAPDLAQLSRQNLTRYKPGILPLLLSLVLLLGMYFVHALIWRRMSIALGGRSFSMRSAAHVFFVSGLGRYIPGKLWQITGMAVLAQRAGISPVAATAASLLGQLGFMTMGMIFLALLLPARFGAKAAIAAVLMVALAAAVFIIGGTERGKTLRHRLLSRFGPRVTEAAALLDRMTVQHAVGWWGAYGLSWILLGSGFALFVSAFVPEALRVPHHLAGSIAASYLIGYLSPTPAGVGAREFIMVPLLAEVIPLPAAVVVSLASRVWFTAAELLPLALIPMLPHNATLDPASST